MNEILSREDCLVYTEGDTLVAKLPGIPHAPEVRTRIATQLREISSLPAAHFVPLQSFELGDTEAVLHFSRPSQNLHPLTDRYEIYNVLQQLCESLELLHERGLFCGWLNPKLVFKDGGQVTIALVLPSLLQSQIKRIEDPFIPPQYFKDGATIDRRVDLYGIGALAYYLTTGEPPSPNLDDLIGKPVNPAVIGALRGEYDLVSEFLGDFIGDSTAAFVVVDGPSKGQSFQLIGKELQIDNPITKKSLLKVSANDYSATAVDSFTINGRSIGVGKRVKLEHGDLLEAKELKLRFLLPGAVYSSRAEVAIRMAGEVVPLQRRATRLGFILAGLALASLGLYQYLAARNQSEVIAHRHSQEQQTQQQLSELTKLGDLALRVGHITQPECKDAKCAELCQNAIECYSKALALSPNDIYIKGRLKEAEEKRAAEVVTRPIPVSTGNNLEDLLTQAKEYLSNRNPDAGFLLRRILSVDPLNPEARDLLTTLAAHTISAGLKARAEGRSADMLQAYDSAVQLGVSPALIQILKSGAEIIKKSHGAAIILDEKLPALKEKEEGFLRSSEVSARLKEIQSGKVVNRRVVDVSSFGNNSKK